MPQDTICVFALRIKRKAASKLDTDLTDTLGGKKSKDSDFHTICSLYGESISFVKDAVFQIFLQCHCTKTSQQDI